MVAPLLVQAVVGQMDAGVPNLAVAPTVGNLILMYKGRPNGFPFLHSGFTNIATVSHVNTNQRFGRMARRVVQLGDTASSYSGLDADNSTTCISEWAGLFSGYAAVGEQAQNFWTNTPGNMWDGVRYPQQLYTPTAGTEVTFVQGITLAQGSNEAPVTSMTPLSGAVEIGRYTPTVGPAPQPTPSIWVGYKYIQSASGSYSVAINAQGDSRGLMYSGVQVFIISFPDTGGGVGLFPARRNSDYRRLPRHRRHGMRRLIR
jgi:hypothetical protein